MKYDKKKAVESNLLTSKVTNILSLLYWHTGIWSSPFQMDAVPMVTHHQGCFGAWVSHSPLRQPMTTAEIKCMHHHYMEYWLQYVLISIKQLSLNTVTWNKSLIHYSLGFKFFPLKRLFQNNFKYMYLILPIMKSDRVKQR